MSDHGPNFNPPRSETVSPRTGPVGTLDLAEIRRMKAHGQLSVATSDGVIEVKVTVTKRDSADAQPEQRTNRQIADRLGQMVTSAGAWLPRHENALVRMLDEQRRESAAADAPPDLATVAKHLRDIESLDCTIDDDAHDHDSQECPFRTARQIARLALGELRRERASTPKKGDPR